MHLFRILFLALFFMPFSLKAQDIKTPEIKAKISIEQAIAYAITTSSELKSSSKNIDLASEDIDLAKSNYRPDVRANASVDLQRSKNNLDNDWDGTSPKGLGITVEQPLFRGGRTVAEIAEKTNLLKSSQMAFSGQVQDKIVDVAAVYMETYRASQAMAVNDENVQLLSEELKATEARFGAGELTKTDVAQAKARLASAQAEYARSQAIYQVAISSFQEETGIKDKVDVYYPEIAEDKIPMDIEIALSIGLEKNPDILVAKQKIEATNKSVDVQKGALYPEVSLGVAMNTQKDSGEFDSQDNARIGLNATIPLYQKGIVGNQIRQSQIRNAQSIDDYETIEGDVSELIIASWEEYKANSAEILARQAQIEAARLAYEGVKLEEQVGARSVLDVLDANQDVRDAELALIEIKRDKVNLYFKLLRAIGILDESFWDNSKTML